MTGRADPAVGQHRPVLDSPRTRKRVLITGAEGTIGTVLRAALGELYELRSLTRDRVDFPSHVADIADLEAIAPAFEEMDAVVHLAATASVSAPWEEVRDSNVVGTYNVYEAARRAGVGLVVFASSNHAIGMYEVEGAPEIYELDDPRVYDEKVELRPDSLYGVSKAYGEVLGRYYVDQHGLRVICLRIGSVRGDDDPTALPSLEAAPWKHLTPNQRRKRQRAVWLSKRDCAELVRCALDADDVRWAVVYGISDNPRQFWDLSSARELLGYEPQDRAPE